MVIVEFQVIAYRAPIRVFLQQLYSLSPSFLLGTLKAPDLGFQILTPYTLVKGGQGRENDDRMNLISTLLP